MNGLPGFDAAKAAGYTLLNHTGDKCSATYVKDDIFLTVYNDNTAEVWSTWKLVKLSTSRIQFPHPRLQLFEQQVMACLPR